MIVTGTARGMGKKMVATFAENGANVVAHARVETDEHLKYCREVAEKNNVQVIPIYFDMREEEAIKASVMKIRKLQLPIDGLVNNAGVTYNALFQMTSMEEVRNQMEVNFFAPYLFTQYISKLMVRNKGGSIVNISSTAAQDGNSGKSAYGASKAALLTMTLCISEELGADGIRANVICPGVTETDMLSTMPDYIMDIQKDAAFLKKIGQTADIANAAMFLLSDYSSYITGQVLRVDGGVTSYAKR
ncbi:MAG: SDR family NAD(P)-dependent oxidoreductase [Clostridium sp.]|nr:SDR family NAD(P)-dependent oxidoreductase [Clostridium sp.]